MPRNLTEIVVEGQRWDEFVSGFRRRWQPGQHVALIGPTGVGKSNLAAHLLQQRKYVLALDPKGGDSTLERLKRHGFERITTWPPPRRIMRDLEKGRPVRLIVGPKVRTTADVPRLRTVISAAVDGAFDMGGWTLYIDELQVAADRRMMNLTGPIERNLIAGRDRGVSVICSYQRPANVPRAASEMSTYLVVWYTRDVDTVDRIAQMMGRAKAEVRAAVRNLPRHAVLVVSLNPHEPMIVTMPTKL